MPRKPTDITPSKAPRGTSYAKDKNPDKLKLPTPFNPETHERVQVAPGLWKEVKKKSNAV